MKPERIQFAPSFGGRDKVPEQEWEATHKVGRSFELAPYSEVPFLAAVLSRARTLPEPPKMTLVVDWHPEEEKSCNMSLNLEWEARGPASDAELEFARWVGGLHHQLSITPEVIT